jgi:hypothetical protein
MHTPGEGTRPAILRLGLNEQVLSSLVAAKNEEEV